MSDPISIRTRSKELKARSVLYQALALLFRHPGREHLKLLTGKTVEKWREAALNCQTHRSPALSLRGHGVPEAISDSEIASASLGTSPRNDVRSKVGLNYVENRNTLEASFESLAGQLKRISLRQWTEEFERLFGHSAHGAIPPYELEYGEQHSHREPQELGDIAAFYQAFGLQLSGEIRERMDHVAVECDFLNFLAFKEAHALEHHGEEKSGICREGRKHFLRDHLSQWLPVFTTRLAKHAQGGLYGAVADLAFTFIAEECAQWGIQPGPRDLPLRALGTPKEIACGACPMNDGNDPASI